MRKQYGFVVNRCVLLIRNGDFKSALSPPWVISTNNASCTIVSGQSHSGSSSSLNLPVHGNPSTTRAVYQDVFDAKTNTIYTLSYSFLPTANGTDLTIRTAPGSALSAVANVRPVCATPGAANSAAGALPPSIPSGSTKSRQRT